jgi:hypothetical protein
LRKFLVLTLAFCSLVDLGPVTRAQSSPSPIATPLDGDGYSALGKIAPAECLVGGTVDLRTMLSKMTDLQAKGAIRGDVDLAHVKARAWSTASAIAFKMQPILVEAVFKDHPDIQTCGFVQTVAGLDGKVTGAFGFKMTRASYAKIDWSSFSAPELPSVWDDFQIGPEIMKHMHAEPSH